MNPAYAALVLGACGAAMQEVAHLYGLRHKLSERRLKALSGSKAYWLVTGAMVVVSGVGTWVWYQGDHQQFRTYVVMGAAFPLILKKAVGMFGDTLKLGEAPQKESFFLGEYFQ